MITNSPPRSLLSHCRATLARTFTHLNPDVAVNHDFYVDSAEQNLIDGVGLLDFEAELRQGDGNELKRKFRAIHSSSALAINSFGWFKAQPEALRLPGGAAFSNICFERKCHHGLVGRRAPNLDILVEGPETVLAVESKFLEPLSRHTAKFSPDYEIGIVDHRRKTAWFDLMQRLIKEPKLYCWLDAAQLVKHAFGLEHTFACGSLTLLYVFWEPKNPDRHPRFQDHRMELERFSAHVQGERIRFISISYGDLWKSWKATGQCDLAAYVQRLADRYLVVI